MKNILIGVGILVVIAGVGWWMLNQVPAPTVQQNNTEETNETNNSQSAYSWEFEDAGEDEEISAPRTTVYLTANGERREVGTYTGTCAEIDGANEGALLANEIAGVVCWWAGGGNEIGIFEEDGEIVVKEGIVDEGTVETGGFRGDFETLFTIQQ